MAIKGKGKTKRRGVAAAPRPVYVQPKKALLARRGFQFTVLGIVVAGALAGFLTGFFIKRANDREEARRAEETAIVQRFGGAVDDSIQGVAQPFSTQVVPLPQFSTDVQSFRTGDMSVEDAAIAASGYRQSAEGAKGAIDAIEVTRMIEGHPDLLPLVDARALMSYGLDLLSDAADAFGLATQEEGKQRTELLRHTEELFQTASTVFTDGYQHLVNVRAAYGILNPISPGQLTPPTPVDQPPPSPGGSGGKGEGGKQNGGKKAGGKGK